MGNSNFYTKGDSEEVLSRIGCVHTLTMFCPLGDVCVQGFKGTLEMMLPQYRVSEDEWKGIPAIDALNAFIFNASVQENFEDVNKDIIGVIISSLKMFKKLKIINFTFMDDDEIEETYHLLLKKKADGTKKYIYNVDVLEFNLSDMFSQRVIDLLNKVFMHNEFIPNSYLKRKFRIDFKYDDYKSFMDMFIGNNRDDLNALDANICNYLRAFPTLVEKQKPDIRVITNYTDYLSE